ncbi:MAG: LytTR family transcriptional regulator DNA-binding domain-containing protein [Prevotellaceae bacterium]|jgi:two-component system LytT family response regulator|nr:LytTR family transcriptional regulator DNA-binding domain-containing protein [Prevotellaceae bacterium]
MDIISTVIVDDELPARELIKRYLKNYPFISVVGEANNGFEALKLLKELKPHLVFLDIQMPKLTGIEVLELTEEHPEVIFSTAYDQHAIRAFELNAVDYLLKPYPEDRFSAALKKVLVRISQKGETGKNHQEKPDIQMGTLTRVAIKDRHQIHIVPVDDIIYIESDGDYVQIYSELGVFMKEKTMRFFEENLPIKRFVRIHRSYIVNVNEVAKIELYDKENYRVCLKNGVALKASASGYKLLKNIVNL